MEYEATELYVKQLKGESVIAKFKKQDGVWLKLNANEIKENMKIIYEGTTYSMDDDAGHYSTLVPPVQPTQGK